ncbi:MAG: NmrA/HSCARG family protein [Acidobacteriota bacterium]|nr:NmrA/HSCARG family protein [Acidobacteriota bacterium]
MTKRIILISGATGQQGGATARALAGKGFTIRALTRNPDSDAAKALAATGAELVKGDLDDEASLKAALADAWGAYAVQNTWTAGVEGEEAQGHRFAKAARAAGVQHFVYASVASADRKTGIPHFDNKSRVEDTVRSLGFTSYAIIRPVFFMENLPSPWFLNGDQLVSALDAKTVLQMIAVSDIGQYGALAFTDERFKNLELDIAGDAATMPQTAEILSGALGRTIEYMQIPMSEIRKNSDDFALMLEWFEAVGYDADIAANAKEYGVKPTPLKEWASRLKK